jgi:hypothetical protein
MTPPAEYAFITMAQFVGQAAAPSSPSVLAVSRVLAPTLALNELGYIARAFSLFTRPAIGAELRSAKVAVFADLGEGPAAAYEALVRDFSGRVFYDLVETPETHSPSERFYRNARVMLTAASEHVARKTSTLVGRPVRTIPEPWHGARQVPHAPQARRRSRLSEWLARRAGLDTETWRLRLFWSGEQNEIEALLDICPELTELGKTLPLTLHCMAPAGEVIERLAEDIRARQSGSLLVTLEPWSPPGFAHALATCDLVLLPDPVPPSRSRLVSALHAGRFCIGRPSSYYGDLAAFAWLGEELVAGIRWALSDSAEVLARLAAGQRHLDEVHAPAVVARTWVQLFSAPG